MVNKARLDDPRFKTLIKQQIRAAWERREQREKDRETIRRLRIQNKKLLARVATLKEQLKKLRTDKKGKKRIL